MTGETATFAPTRAQKLLLGRAMRQCRKRSGLSLDELARATCISCSTLADWESGDRLPTPQNLRTWFDALDANDWYREKILGLSRPSLFERELTANQRFIGPSVVEQQQMESHPFPVCYRRLHTYELIAANSAFRRTFPGLEPAPASADRPTNFIEWLVSSPEAKFVIADWRRHTHVLVNALQILSPGVVPGSYIESITADCSENPDFADMWNTDVTNADIRNDNLGILGPGQRLVNYTTSTYRSAAEHGRWEMLVLTPS